MYLPKKAELGLFRRNNSRLLNKNWLLGSNLILLTLVSFGFAKRFYFSVQSKITQASKIKLLCLEKLC